MNLRIRYCLSKQTLTHLKRITTISTTSSSSAVFAPHNNNHVHNNNHNKPHLGNVPFLRKSFHSSPQLNHSLQMARANEDDYEDEATMNEFLSRFVYRMRGKLNEAYPDCDKTTIDAMLLVIVEKLVSEMEKGGSLEEKLIAMGDDFSEDLWKTVWEVSNNVYQEMEREKKKEKLKMFLQSEDVKAMARFASEVGVRGDMLRELRFKWAREEMEKAEFFERLEGFREVSKKRAEVEVEAEAEAEAEVEAGGLPKRYGKIKYKLYGLDLSGPQWREVADKIHEAGEVIWPQEAKPISGKGSLITEKILGLGKNSDYESVISPLLNEWKELLQPSRVDWISLIDKLKEKDRSLYLKVAEHVLDEPSFQANMMDYSKLIDAYARESNVEDTERLLKKMNDNGMPPDFVTLTALLHMYSKTNNLEQAEEAYKKLTSQGFKPDMDIYHSMITVYVNAGKPKEGEKLLQEMEFRDIKQTEEIYMAILRGFAKAGDVNGANKIGNAMQYAGVQPTLESCTLLIEACVKPGNSDEARYNFDYMMKLGFKPDDRSTSLLISAYEKKNELNKALSILLKLEKNGFEPGVSTYTVLVCWMGKLQLVDEAEQILAKIAQLGEAPPFEIQVSLCEMYATAGIEKKTLRALGVLEAKKDLLRGMDFERIIHALLKGGFLQDAQRMQEVMQAQGFTQSEVLQINMMGARSRKSGGRRPRMS